MPGCTGAAKSTGDDMLFSPANPDLAGADLVATPSCEETHDNILGPYYRANAPERSVLAAPGEGQKLILVGTIRGLAAGGICAAVPGALIEVWQANADGAYDTTTPEFHWRGVQHAGADGSYRFETILPGLYLNGDVYRPHHVHYKVSAPGQQTLVTQLYFEGDPYLATDPYYHPSLVKPISKDADTWSTTFDIVLGGA